MDELKKDWSIMFILSLSIFIISILTILFHIGDVPQLPQLPESYPYVMHDVRPLGVVVGLCGIIICIVVRKKEENLTVR
jgi:hypothetical protein